MSKAGKKVTFQKVLPAKPFKDDYSFSDDNAEDDYSEISSDVEDFPLSDEDEIQEKQPAKLPPRPKSNAVEPIQPPIQRRTAWEEPSRSVEKAQAASQKTPGKAPGR